MIELMLPPDEMFECQSIEWDNHTAVSSYIFISDDRLLWFKDNPIIFAAAASTMWRVFRLSGDCKSASFALDQRELWAGVASGDIKTSDVIIVAYDKEKTNIRPDGFKEDVSKECAEKEGICEQCGELHEKCDCCGQCGCHADDCNCCPFCGMMEHSCTCGEDNDEGDDDE